MPVQAQPQPQLQSTCECGFISLYTNLRYFIKKKAIANKIIYTIIIVSMHTL